MVLATTNFEALGGPAKLDTATGVCPSPGAGNPGLLGALEYLDVGLFAVPAAPEDGRTPVRRRDVAVMSRCALRGRTAGSISIFLSIFLLLTAAWAARSSAKDSPSVRAERAFVEAQGRFRTNGHDPEVAWQFGRACFDWADFTEKNSRRAEIAESGIAACRQAIGIDPKLAAAHYYLGLNLGQLARTKKLGAFRVIDEMQVEVKAAIALEPSFAYAGPHRSLGLLYLEAPGWPASIGNRSSARLHLRKAVELCPRYPDNWLSLLEAYLKWDETSAVQPQLGPTEEMLQQARK